MPITLTAPWYLYLGSLAGFLSFGGWGWYRYRVSGLSWAVLGRFLIAVFSGPIWQWQLMTSFIELENTTISWTTGAPWAAETQTANFAGVRAITITEVGSGRTRGQAWLLQYADGSRREIRLTDLWRANQDEIAAHLAAHGIPVPK